MPGATTANCGWTISRPKWPFAHFAEHAHAPPRRERLLLARVEVEEAQHELRAAAEIVAAVLEHRDELAPRTVLDLGADDRALGLLLRAGRERGERHEARVILVAQRQVEDQVLLARDAEARKLVGERRAPGFARGLFARPRQSYGTSPSTRTASTSMRAPRGSPATWYVARAG